MVYPSDPPSPETSPGSAAPRAAGPPDPEATRSSSPDVATPDPVQLLHLVARAAAGSHDLRHLLAVVQGELNRHLAPNLCLVWLTAAVHRVAAASETDAGLQANPKAGEPANADPHHELVLSDPYPAALPRVQALGLRPALRCDVRQTPFVGCVEKGEPAGAGVQQASDPLTAVLADHGVSAWLAVPLHAGEQVGGVLQGLCLQPGALPPAQAELLQLVADLLGPAISNCLLVARLRRAYEELRLTQSQLIQAEKERALGELSGAMAHEFNNALCGVLGFIEVTLLGKGLDSVSRSHLESARACALRAAQSVRDVQNLARQGRQEMAVQPEAAADSDGDADGPPPPGARRLRVLVIEDDAAVRRFLKATLRSLGHEVQASADAEAGLAAFARERFDLVFTDLGLPGASGQEVARVVRLRSPQTPVVLLTGWADQLEPGDRRADGVTRILGKPVAIEELTTTLAEVCPRPS